MKKVETSELNERASVLALFCRYLHGISTIIRDFDGLRIYLKINKLNKKECFEKLSLLLGVPSKDIQLYWDEIQKNSKFFKDTHRLGELAIGNYYYDNGFLPFHNILYIIVRSTKPKNIVETGCYVGHSSATILEAINKNDFGHLYTIDLPLYGETVEDGMTYTLPNNQRSGYIIPFYLRKNWTLLEGKAEDLLESLLKKIKKTDIFFHDSLHTYNHMLWEFKTVWPYLENHGILISDDVSWNDAFKDFSMKNKIKPHYIKNLGILYK